MILHIGSAGAILFLFFLLVTFLAFIFTADHHPGKLLDPNKIGTNPENDPDVVFEVTREYQKWQEYEEEKERRNIAELDAQAGADPEDSRYF